MKSREEIEYELTCLENLLKELHEHFDDDKIGIEGYLTSMNRLDMGITMLKWVMDKEEN